MRSLASSSRSTRDVCQDESEWAVTDLDNRASIAVCKRIGMRLLGVTHRWYEGPSQMFSAGREDGQQPSLRPDIPASQF